MWQITRGYISVPLLPGRLSAWQVNLARHHLHSFCTFWTGKSSIKHYKTLQTCPRIVRHYIEKRLCVTCPREKHNKMETDGLNQWKSIKGSFANVRFKGKSWLLARLVSPKRKKEIDPLPSRGHRCPALSLLQSKKGPKMIRTFEMFHVARWSWNLPGLVNIQKAIENGHRNSWFSHEKWWIFP